MKKNKKKEWLKKYQYRFYLKPFFFVEK